VQVLGSGTPALGTMRAKAPTISSFLAASFLAPYNALLAENAARSTWGYAVTSSQLWSYFLTQEKRSPVVGCGDGFVRIAAPHHTMAVTLKLTFPSSDERDLFGRCFTQGDPDVTRLADPGPLSRFLVQHQATLAIHVLSAAGPVAAIQQVLDDTQCSTVNLPGCATTLDSLTALKSALVEAPDDTLPLAELAPGWGVFDFQVGSYALLPD
jgi:hypothetical protein